jgi:hypothetical protein
LLFEQIGNIDYNWRFSAATELDTTDTNHWERCGMRFENISLITDKESK